MRALFLNPLPARKRRKAKKARTARRRKRMTRWQSLVKKHGGNMVAARREYAGKSASGTRSTSRRRAAGASKRRKSAGKRRKVAPVARRKSRTATRRRRKATKVRARRRKPVAARKVRRRRRKPVFAPSVTWRRAIRSKTGKRVKAHTSRKKSVRRWKAGMRKGLRGKGTRKWRRAVLAGVRAVNPRKRGRSRRTYRKNYRRNPIFLSGFKTSVKDLIAKSALKDYLYVTAGLVAGGILPGFLTRALYKLKVLKSAPSQMLDVGLGIGSAILAGVGAGMITKRKDVAAKVAGGAIAGILGAMALRLIEQKYPTMVAAPAVAGLGASADSSVRRAIEAEIRRSAGVSGGGVGEFITQQRLESELSGLGAFVTSDVANEALDVSGLGSDVSEDIEDGTDTFDGGSF